MIMCPGLFSLPRKSAYIAYFVPSTFAATYRLLQNNRIEALNVGRTECPLYPVFLGSEEKQGNNIRRFTRYGDI